MNSNLKISLRSIKRNKVHSFISIIGLGIGLGSIMLLSVLYIHDKSFDRFIPDSKNVYRVIQGNFALTSYPLAEVLKSENPAVEDFFRYYQKNEVEIKNSQNEIQKDKRFALADASIFRIWGIKMKLGVAAQTKTEVAISEEMERKYFPGESAMGKQIKVKLNEEFLPLTVSGVYSNFPSNSTLSPEFVANIELSGEAFDFEKKMIGTYSDASFKDFKSWDRKSFYTYVRLVFSSKSEEVTAFMQKYKSFTNNDKLKEEDFILQTATNVYLGSGILNGSVFSRLGNAKDLGYYLTIASLILLIAIINYVFLTRAKIESRLKEIGSQKALGASIGILSKQIVLESNIVAFLSLLPASIVIFAGIPFINNILNQSIDIHVFTYWKTWGVLLGIVLLTGTISGLFIAHGTVKVPPVILLKGKKTTIPKRKTWSNAILGIHFFIFIVLIASVLTLNKQITFALNDFIGINPKNILVYELNSNELSKKYRVIKNEVDRIPGVVASAGSSFVPPFNSTLPLRLVDGNGNSIRLDGLIMGQGMIELLGIQVAEGESFGEYATGTPQVIYNESAARKYNLKAGDLFSNLKVRGIVKDFNAHSMHDLIQPMAIIQQHPDKMRLFVVKTNGIDNIAISKSIEEIFKKIAPDEVVDSYLLTDQINHFYISEKNQSKLVNAFALLAIVLSVMGLLGMTYNSTLRRRKEVGIRKVNGAKISEILIILNKDFVKWVVIAFIVATPVAYYVMNKWLESFAYKTNLSWWIFALAGVLALGIALLTTSWQSWRAATRNPVEVLRYE